MSSFPMVPSGFGAGTFGGGGALHVVNALAVAGQTVRVVFDEEPVHQTPAGTMDALNPTNYQLFVLDGQAVTPQALGVDPPMVTGPALGVPGMSEERGFDVRVDRSLIVGIRYRIMARNVRSRVGGSLSPPQSADFMGIVAVKASQPPSRRQDLADLANDPLTGTYNLDNSGDIAVQDGLVSLKKRVLRRLQTGKGSYSFLPDYGTKLKLKSLVSVANLGDMQGDMIQQLKQEPDVQNASVQLTLVPLPGILTVDVRVQSKPGSFTAKLTLQNDGSITVT